MDITNVLMIVLYVLAGLAILTILVVVHEGGHFLIGKKLGFGIVEFGVGFGPKLFSKVRKGIRYSLRAFPVGGFVQFVGEDDNDSDPKAFNNQPAWKRLLTIFAGPFMNVICALVLTMAVLLSFGDTAPYIMEVQENTPACEAGIIAGDRIAGINGKTIDFYSELSLKSNEGIFTANGDFVSLTVERDGELLSYEIPFNENEDGTKTIGILYGGARRHFGFFEAISLSFKWMYLLIVETIKALGLMFFKGQGTQDLMGPVGTVMYIGKATVYYGFEVALRLASMISINLAVINLLPFPGLDGGRMMFLGIEKITGNRVPKNIEGIINFAGLVLLLILIVVLTVQDVTRGLV